MVTASEKVSQRICELLPSVQERFECVSEKILDIVRENPPDPEEERHEFDTFSDLLATHGVAGNPTGEERCLKDLLMASPERSVSLDRLFGFSYLGCNKRRLLDSLVTIYAVLEDGAFEQNRDNLPLQKKIVLMRPGENFGPNYHFFGSALLAMCAGNWPSWLMLAATHSTKRNKQKNPDIEKMEIDMLGQELGKRLSDF
jgi:hypothetical protein